MWPARENWVADYVAGAGELGGGAGERPASGSVIAPTTASPPAIKATISPPFQCSWLTPSASELLTECRAMHGYSDPVFQRTRHSTNPRKPSGMRYCALAEPACARPNSRPVSTAATHV